MMMQCERIDCKGQVMDLGDGLRCLNCDREPIHIIMLRDIMRFDDLDPKLTPSLTPTPKHHYEQEHIRVRIPPDIL